MSEPDIGYIIMERIYDDSGDQYCPHECKSIKFFWDKEKAEKEAIKRTADAFLKYDLYRLGEDCDDLTSKNINTVVKELAKLGYDWDGYFEDLCVPIHQMSLEKRIKLVGIFDQVEFFYVEEIEVEE